MFEIVAQWITKHHKGHFWLRDFDLKQYWEFQCFWAKVDFARAMQALLIIYFVNVVWTRSNDNVWWCVFFHFVKSLFLLLDPHLMVHALHVHSPCGHQPLTLQFQKSSNACNFPNSVYYFFIGNDQLFL